MEYDIKEKKENPLLSRTELSIEIRHTGSANPSYETIKKEIANKLKEKQELIIIKHVYPAFGEGKSDAEVYIYKDEKALTKNEPQEIKKKAEAEKKPAEAKKQEAKETPAKEKPKGG